SSSSGSTSSSSGSSSSSKVTASGDAPTTGVKDVTLPITLIALAVLTAFASRSRKKDEEE
ncbi:MAG: hypothetical protein J6I55_08410, partial [Ruminococcus sp.]|nr:hypothetical protein [Ruminococcus sp.]